MSIAKHEPTLLAAEWEPYFRKAKIRIDDLDASKGQNGKSIRIGMFLGSMVGRRVPIRVNGRTGTAELIMRRGHGGKRYGLVIRWDPDSEPTGPVQPVTGTEPLATQPPADKSPDNGVTTMTPPAATPVIATMSPANPGCGDGQEGNREQW
jgi:hypothetical protein